MVLRPARLGFSVQINQSNVSAETQGLDGSLHSQSNQYVICQSWAALATGDFTWFQDVSLPWAASQPGQLPAQLVNLRIFFSGFKKEAAEPNLPRLNGKILVSS